MERAQGVSLYQKEPFLLFQEGQFSGAMYAVFLPEIFGDGDLAAFGHSHVGLLCVIFDKNILS
jgi:hypothetical protein